MKMISLTMEGNPRDFLLEVLEKYQDKQAILILSMDAFLKLKKEISFNSYDSKPHEWIGIVREKGCFNYYPSPEIGTAIFEFCEGIYVLKRFSSDRIKYHKVGQEVEMIICLDVE